jgi:hypothetical protein
MHQVFKSKVDAIIVWPVIINLTLVFVIMAFDAFWPGMIFLLLLGAFILHTFYNITYSVIDHQLLIKTGFFKYGEIDIHQIRYIEYTRTGYSSPAASLDRINLQCGKKGTITISPENKEAFIQLLLSIHPEIVIKPVKK